ncbi:MAG: zinc-binding dehydrogenase [Planctomycetes bacterium]|nr:zinc-binding dehydrogenase [Planctomycetota bacterium]
MPTTPDIRAAIFDGPGAALRVENVARPVLGDGEALVRVSLCTVCGSDLHTFTGRRKEKTPCVLGHEPVGVVEEVADDLRTVDGEPVRVGDRVVWAVAVSCGACFFCEHGLPQKCESLRKYGHEAISPQCGPVGGLATHCHLLKGTAVVKVPAELPDAVAAPAGCATATVAAVLRAWAKNLTPQPPSLKRKGEKSTPPSFTFAESQEATPEFTPFLFREGGRGVRSDSVIVVFGLGMLGLTACAWLESLGATAIACDVSDARLAQATRFGARHLAKPDALAELVKSLTHGRGADAALELSGSPQASAAALGVLRVGGTAVWAGAVSPTDPVPVLPETIVRRCLTVTGVHNYAPPDLADAVRFLAAKHERFPFAELVTKSFPLANVTDAFRFAESERPVRVSVACG